MQNFFKPFQPDINQRTIQKFFPEGNRRLVRKSSVPVRIKREILFITAQQVKACSKQIEWVIAAGCEKCGLIQKRKAVDLLFPDACLLYTSDAADDLLCVDLG